MHLLRRGGLEGVPIDLSRVHVLLNGALRAHGQLRTVDRRAIGLSLEGAFLAVVAGVGEGELLVAHGSTRGGVGHRERALGLRVGVGHRHLSRLILDDGDGLRLRGGQRVPGPEGGVGDLGDGAGRARLDLLGVLRGLPALHHQEARGVVSAAVGEQEGGVAEVAIAGQGLRDREVTVIHGHGVSGVAQCHGRELLVRDGRGAGALAVHHEGRLAPDDTFGSSRGIRGVLVECEDRSNGEDVLEHGLGTDAEGHLEVTTSTLLVEGARGLPVRVGAGLRTAGQVVVDTDLESGVGRHLAGLRSGEELGDLESTESGLHLDVDGEGRGVVHRVGAPQAGSQRGGVVLVPHTGLHLAVAGLRSRLVADDVVATRREGTGHLDEGDVAVEGDIEVEVARAGVLVRSGSVRELDGTGVLALSGAGLQPPLRLVGNVLLSGAELVGEHDGRAGLAVHAQRLAVLLQRRLDLVGAEDQLPGNLVGVDIQVAGPLGDLLRLVGALDVGGNLPAGNGHSSVRTVGLDRQVGQIRGPVSHHQRRPVSTQVLEALGDDLVELTVEGAGDRALSHRALTHLRADAIVVEHHRLGELVLAADLLGQCDLEGVPTLGVGLAGIPAELQLEVVTALDRGLARVLLADGVGGGQ